MAEEDPNPVIRESPQYNVERLDICLNYLKNVMDIPVAVTAYDIHNGKLASIFSLLMQLIRYYRRGLEMKSKVEAEENANEDEVENIKELINNYSDENRQDLKFAQ